MMPPVALLVIKGIQSSISSAPTKVQAIKLAKEGKDYIAALLAAGIVTQDEETRLHAHIDAVAENLKNGPLP